MKKRKGERKERKQEKKREKERTERTERKERYAQDIIGRNAHNKYIGRNAQNLKKWPADVNIYIIANYHYKSSCRS